MPITVYNVSATTARVRWPAYGGCRDTFYSMMYDPHWSSLEVGYKRKRFKHEERIPASRTGADVVNLLPNTAYFLCVTCQAANPIKDQCQIFSTLGGDSPGGGGGGAGGAGGGGGGGWETAMGLWMASSLLLLLVSGVLLWGCLHNVCPLPRHGHRRGRPDTPGFIYGAGGGANGGAGEDDVAAKRATVILNPLFGSLGVRGSRGVVLERGGQPLHQQEIRGFTKLSGCEPV
ncbi:fibronectin type III domain-containing protein 9 [Gadus morhua]|uniref:Fibronectin type-III domain-containing protein n=1 Tax=Gadus morhua TaxID=8049 RepID=A0A8C5B8Q2_GADMO|nr:fibronectin type III domain-containing protein 9 [Gadus morhua]